MNLSRIIGLLGAVAGLGAAALPAMAQSNYPDRAIELVVPYAAGGGFDTLARTLVEPLSEELGQQIVVVNRGGGGATIGSKEVADAEPDGYTLLLGGTASHAIGPALRSDIPYDPVGDFAPIGYIGEAAYFLVVNPTVADDVESFLETAKSDPGGMNYASPGNGSSIHLAMELLKSEAGIDLVQIPYTGTGPSIIDILDNRVQATFAPGSAALSHIESGGLKALAVSTMARSPLLPNVPTLDESGVAGFNAGGWYGLFAPAGTPPEIVETLHSALNAVLESDGVKDQMASLGIVVDPGSPEDLLEQVNTEGTKWKSLIESAGIETN